MCVCVCLCDYVCLCMCILHAYGGQRFMLNILFVYFRLSIWDKFSHWTCLECASQDWMTNNIREFACLCLLHPQCRGLQTRVSCLAFLLGSELWSSCTHSQHLTGWVIFCPSIYFLTDKREVLCIIIEFYVIFDASM